jgi:hypothetical protein
MLNSSMATRTPTVLLAALACAALSCQTIAGVEDKQLDPSLSAGSDAGLDVTSDVVDDTAQDVGEDVPSDAPEEVADGGAEDGALLYPPRPPERPDGGALDAAPDADGGGGRVLTFAVRRFFFGSIDPDTDIRTFEAWQQFGFDIDGFCTSSSQSQNDSSGVCSKPPSATALCQEDAFGCRDNTVGHLIAEVLYLSVTDFERAIHARTRSGVAQTLIIQLLDVDDGPDDPYVPANIYVSAPTTFPPLWDGTDVFPLDEDYVDVDVQPKYVLENGYIRDHMYVSGDFNDSPTLMPVMLLDEVAEVQMDTATLAIQLDDANVKAAHAMFASVVDIELLAPLLERGVLEATDCNQGIADQAINGYFLPSRDLVAGAPGFVDPTAVCDRQSFGVLFDLVTVMPPVEAVAVEPQPSACD